MVLLLGFLIGMCCGLRSMTPIAVIAWAAQSGLPDLRSTWFGFLAAPLSAYVTTAFAGLELIFDKLPFTPSRLTAGPLAARILMGGFCGAAIFAASQGALKAGAFVSSVGGGVGSAAGYFVRRALVKKFGLPDLFAALLEDVVTIGGAMLIVSRV